MKRIVLQLVTIMGSLLTVAPAFFVFYGEIEWATNAKLMVLGFILYFGSAPFWMKIHEELDA